MTCMRRDPVALARARELRQNANEAEKKVWWMLRAKHIGGNKFRRQHPIGPYVVDFVCLRQRLVIEIDGDTHDDAQRELDRTRTRYLNKLGFRVIRFWNDDVYNFTSDVESTIAYELGMSDPSPLPSPLRGEGDMSVVT